MKSILKLFFGFCFFQVSLGLNPRVVFAVIDENFVCNIKKSCVDCLRLPHCSWCESENKCFSDRLPEFKDYCKDNTTEIKNFGLSLEDNAQCSCVEEQITKNCYPAGVTEGPECSGRGECRCGRCICNTHPDPEHPTKMVMGEFCDLDNFACDGPKCNEGPYSINNQLRSDTDLLDLDDI